METRVNRWGEAGPMAMQASVWSAALEQEELQVFAERRGNPEYSAAITQIVQPLLDENGRLIDLVQRLRVELDALRERLRQVELAATRDGR